MEKNFKYTGDWFLPKQKRNKCKGVLRFNVDEGISLEVYGNLNGQPKYSGNEEAKVIFGILNDGQLVSLYNTFVTNASNKVFTKSGGEATYSVNYCFIGIHVIDSEDVLVENIRFNIFNSEEWFGHLGFNIERNFDIKPYELNIHYSTPDSIEFSINDYTKGNIKFSFGNSNWTEKGIEANSRVYFEIISEKGIKYSQIVKYTAHMEMLLSCFIGRGIYSEDVNFSVLKKEKGAYSSRSVKFIGISKYSQKEAKIIEAPFCLIRYNNVKETLPSIIGKWFDLLGDYSEIIYTLIESLTYNTHFSELNFWNLTRITEGFDRIDRGLNEDEKVTRDLYLNKLDLAIQTLKDNHFHHQDIIEKISDGIKYGYEPNLRDRLNGLVKSINSSPIRSIIADNRKKRDSFVHNVVNIRNKFTHPDQEDVYYTLERMISLSVKLRLLLWYHFMKKIGIEDEVIGQSVNNNNRLKFW